MADAVDNARATRGLATIALLKVNFDAGRDHLSMFEPFVLDTLGAMQTDSTDTETVRRSVSARHGLGMPYSVIQTLLGRAVRRGYLRREAGRFFFTENRAEQPDLLRERKEVERRQLHLANALCARAPDLGVEVSTSEDAFALILEFLERYHVAIALDDASGALPHLGPEPAEDDARSSRITSTARFLLEIVAEGGEREAILQEILEGFVLQNALLLKDIASAGRRFSDLQVYLDSGVVFAAIGCLGPAERTVATELFDLLRSAGASLNVFGQTLDEMLRILHVFESRIGTSTGRSSLYPTELTRYFLTNHYSPSDIAQLAAFLKRDLRGLGVTIRDTPTHQVNSTLDEARLSTRLADRPGEENAPRVVHDVDCVAAVLTLRRGRTTQSLDDAGPIFVTRSGLTAVNVTKWYESEGETGIPPIIDVRLLSNFAWLKRPASASRLKLHELVALCTAALRPSRPAWRAFLAHLRGLRESGAISDDEAALVLVSSLTDRFIADEFDPDDTDAQSISEVIERVRATYRAEADRDLQAATSSLAGHEAEIQRLRRRLERLARRTGAGISWSVAVVLTGVFAVGTTASIVSGATGQAPSGWEVAFAAIPLAIGGLFGLVTGFHLRAWRRAIEEGIIVWVRSLLSGRVDA